MRGPYTRRISPGIGLHPEVYRHIISEASAEDNREFVRYATGDKTIWPPSGGVNRNVTHNTTDTLLTRKISSIVSLAEASWDPKHGTEW